MQLDFSKKGKGMADGCKAVDNLAKNYVGWQPPSSEYIKINVNASFVESFRVVSMRVVARYRTGEVIISSWDFIGSCTSVDEAELRACLTDLYIGITLRKSIILESDCSFVVFYLANEILDRSALVN